VFNLLLPQILKKVKEIFETINSKLDTTVSSRLASNDTRLNNLDATISSRLASNDTRLNNLDAPISSAGKRPRIQKFTSSGTFTVPPGVEIIYVTGYGGGGGGGSGAAHSTYPYGGGGGASGVMGLRIPLGVQPGDTLSIAIGAGGQGGQSVTGRQFGQNGTSGGATIVYQNGIPRIQFFGGNGGSGTSTSPGTGGTAPYKGLYPYYQSEGFDGVSYKGGAGGQQNVSLSRASGGSSYGASGSSPPNNSGGGGGGGAGQDNDTQYSGAGGNGGSGFLMLEWWE